MVSAYRKSLAESQHVATRRSSLQSFDLIIQRYSNFLVITCQDSSYSAIIQLTQIQVMRSSSYVKLTFVCTKHTLGEGSGSPIKMYTF